MLFFTFKNLKNSGLIPKLKDEREGREIEHGCLVEVMKKKNYDLPATGRQNFQRGNWTRFAQLHLLTQ